jgi:phage terminase small subunit
MAGSQIPRTPTGLAARGKALWREINQCYELDPVEVELLLELCRVLDLCDRIERELKRGKLLVEGYNAQPRVNPLVAALANAQKNADRLAGSLAISMPGESGVGRGRAHQVRAAQTRWRRSGRAAGSVTSIVGGA